MYSTPLGNIMIHSLENRKKLLIDVLSVGYTYGNFDEQMILTMKFVSFKGYPNSPKKRPNRFPLENFNLFIVL